MSQPIHPDLDELAAELQRERWGDVAADLTPLSRRERDRLRVRNLAAPASPNADSHRQVAKVQS